MQELAQLRIRLTVIAPSVAEKNTILGVPYYNYSKIYPQTLF